MLPVVVFGVALIVFVTMYLAPGDPALVMLGPEATHDALQALRRDLGLDEPLVVRFGRWLAKAVQGDFGRSVWLNRPVLPEVVARFKATVLLAGTALAISAAGGILVGVVAATRRNSIVDRAVMLGAILGASLPVFWTGLVLIIIFAVRLGWLPAFGMYSPAGGGVKDLVWHLVLPSVTLALPSMSVIARLTRSSMLDVLRQDYIRTARAKGISEVRVHEHHAFRNAVIPTLTVIGVQTGYLLGGSVLTETVFSWPGLGTLMMRGVLSRDFPLVQGCVLLVAVAFILVNLIVDMMYGLLDPRIVNG
jgi:ABC-type dipeptide/oligopeptide/nickel transport system permease component